jgi:CubicO group peptidase (beta-lactamase class C family)
MFRARFGGPFPCAALLMCCGLAASAFAQGKDPARLALDDFASFFKERSAAHGIVGASLRVASRGGAVRHTSFGFKDRATGALTDEATIYHGASITKTNTRTLDAEIRDFFVSRLAPALEGAPVAR